MKRSHHQQARWPTAAAGDVAVGCADDYQRLGAVGDELCVSDECGHVGRQGGAGVAASAVGGGFGFGAGDVVLARASQQCVRGWRGYRLVRQSGHVPADRGVQLGELAHEWVRRITSSAQTPRSPETR